MRFCFYSGYKDLKGGYTTLLLTLIKELYHQKQEVLLINYAEGLIADELKKANIDIKIIDLDEINWQEIDKKIFSTDIFILTKFVDVYQHLFTINPRVIYFDINDFICQISDYKFGIKLPFFGKKLIVKLHAANSLLFMDDTGIFNLKKYFSLDIADPQFLAIPVTVPAENIRIKNIFFNKNSFNLTYIGRSVDWKMMPLKKILDDCATIDNKYSINFSIVVDSIAAFEKFININDYKNANIKINLIENMLPSAVNDFLLQNADIHFAMGTAALDAAKLGIPTIAMDYSTKGFPDNYQYKWIDQMNNYSLGRNIDKMAPEKGISMGEVLNILSNDNMNLEYSKKSYRYVAENHAAQKIINTLVKRASIATFRICDARPYIPFYSRSHLIIKRIFSFFKKMKM
jgi:hypothetical protein